MHGNRDGSVRDCGTMPLAAAVRAVTNADPVGPPRPVGGGCIHQAALLTTTSGRRLFVKRNHASFWAVFETEAAGLLALAGARVPRVPKPYAVGREGDQAYLIIEAVDAVRAGVGFHARFGAELAELHRTMRAPQCGFERDNHIGSTPQPNPWTTDWFAFFAAHRLGYQVQLSRRNGLLDSSAERDAERLCARLPDLLPPLDDGGASLLHGDLWAGNYLCAADGAPVLIDPAVYFGHREADLAMTALFGGFDPDFYRAYHHHWPLVSGFRERFALYNLYHLLNHLNLFGAAYRSEVLATLRRYR